MMKDYRQLLQLYQKGLPVNRIANILGCKWETVRDAMERMKVAYGALESIPDGDGDREIADRIRQSGTHACPLIAKMCSNVSARGKASRASGLST